LYFIHQFEFTLPNAFHEAVINSPLNNFIDVAIKKDQFAIANYTMANLWVTMPLFTPVSRLN